MDSILILLDAADSCALSVAVGANNIMSMRVVCASRQTNFVLREILVGAFIQDCLVRQETQM